MYSAKLQTIRLLNGLTLLNNERAAGYSKALSLLHNDPGAEWQPVNMQLVLSNFIRDSKLFSKTLENIVLIEGGKMPYNIKVSRPLFEMLKALQLRIAGMNRQHIISYCHYCETMIQEAYLLVLNDSLAPDPKEIVMRQKTTLQKGQVFINALKEKPGQQPDPSGKTIICTLHPLDAGIERMAKISG